LLVFLCIDYIDPVLILLMCIVEIFCDVEWKKKRDL
jgi:hypothetical protein